MQSHPSTHWRQIICVCRLLTYLLTYMLAPEPEGGSASSMAPSEGLGGNPTAHMILGPISRALIQGRNFRPDPNQEASNKVLNSERINGLKLRVHDPEADKTNKNKTIQLNQFKTLSPLMRASAKDSDPRVESEINIK